MKKHMKKSDNAAASGIRKDRELIDQLRRRISSRVGSASAPGDISVLAGATEAAIRAGAVIDDRERMSKERR